VPVPVALASLFTSASRARGEDYARTGRVRLVNVHPTAIDAVVRGTERYHVHLGYERNPAARVQTLEVSCTCAYYIDGADTCKHIWATLVVAAEQPGTFLMALDGARAGTIDVASALEEFESSLDVDPDEEAATDPGLPASRLALSAGMRKYWQNRRARGRPFEVPPSERAPRVALPPASPGQRLLASVAQAMPDAPALAPRFRYGTDDLIYVLDLDAVRHTGGLLVEVLARERKRDGSWATPRQPRLTALDLQAAPVLDAEILSALVGASQAAALYGGTYALPSTFPVPTPLARLLIPRIAQTGRMRVRDSAIDPSLLAVTWDDGPAWRFAIRADRSGDGCTVAGSFVRDGTDEVRSSEDTFLVLESGFLITATTVARAILPPYRSLFAALLKSGPVALTAAEVATLAETLAVTGVSGLDLPEPLRVAEIDVASRPRLSLRAQPGVAMRGYLSGEVSFDYDGTIVPAHVATSPWDPTTRRLVRRRPAEEAAALERLSTFGVRMRWSPYDGQQAWTVSVAAMPALVRALLSEGWQVEADGRAFQRPSRVAMSVSSGIDWFDLSATVEFGETAVPLTDVLSALKRGEASVRLGDGRLGLLPEEWLKRYAPLAALGEAEGDRLRFRLPQTALLDALLEAQADETTVKIDETFAAARRELTRFDRVEAVRAPASFTGHLRPYQQEGLGWLGFLRRFGFGGCLADDMGLGKTVMVLAMLDALRRDRPLELGRRPSLVVAPRSIVHNWLAEAARFTPELVVRDFSHATRKTVADDVWHDADLVIATYGTLRRDITDLKDRELEYVILDEAQTIKNAGTAAAKAARLLRGRHRLALSGTPIENHLGELWSLFDFLNPGLLGRSSAFAGVGSNTRTVDPETATLVSRGLRPFILRRTKAQVATDLPPKTEQTILCELEGKQRTFYNSLRAHYRHALLGRVEKVGLKKSKLLVIEALLRLRQAACHPALIDPAHARTSSSKIDTLVPRLREVVNEGHKAIVFSQFTSFLALVREALTKEGIVYEYLDGQTRDREARVARFQQDADCRVFLVSLKAGGLGLNLTAAEYVFLLDPWWNPAVEAQAIDRAHRIGQTEHVFAYRLIARDTVEEKVLALQQTKRALADAILRADAGLIGQLGREDLELLLS
jgi:superfamily II DNA or RNA helicase